MLRQFLACIFLAAIGVSAVDAQTDSTDKVNPLKSETGGLQLQSVSSFAGYSSASVVDQGGAGVTAQLSYIKPGERTGLAISYIPTVSFQFAGGRNDDHSLSINWRRNLTPLWTFTISGAGNITSLTDSVFQPTALANVAAVPATFEDLAGAIMSGASTNSQLATLLTSARPIESPAGLLLFGSRSLSTAVTTGLVYSRSSRMTIRVNLMGSRAQPLSYSGGVAGANNYLLSNSTAGSASIGIGYSLSPRTQLGFDASTSRTFSSIQDVYTTTGNVSLARTMGMRWFLQLHSGVGIINPVRESFALPQKPQYQGGGGLGYKVHTQTFLASVERSVSDGYGFGANSSLSATGAWSWTQPGSSWSVTANFGQQWLTGSHVQNFNSWRAMVGLSRKLSRQMAISAQYGYLSASGLTAGPKTLLGQHMVRMSVTWLPNGGATKL